MSSFIGVDLGRYGKPSGLASLRLNGTRLQLRGLARLPDRIEILDWISNEAGDGDAMVAVDAPLIIGNQTGIRPVERA
jgi:predicted RNase H-like nuclease